MDWLTATDDIAQFLSQEQAEIGPILQRRHGMGRTYAWMGQGNLVALGSDSAQQDPKMYKAAAEQAHSQEQAPHVAPHILEVASLAFTDLLYTKRDQSVVFM